MKSVADIFRSYAVFDAQGKHVNGTDKMSNHNYGDAYEQIINSCWSSRYDITRMMEVGVAGGECLLAWREIFPLAWIIGMDIMPDAGQRLASEPRISFHQGDQRVREDCERAAQGRLFDLIVEDATHNIGNTLLTMYWLWPFVRPGGLYVVEEWDGVGGDRARIKAMFPYAEIIDTQGPFGGIEPLVAFRKP